MSRRPSHIGSAFIPVGAILKKDTVTHLRQTRAFVTLLLGACGCGLVVYAAWPKTKTVSWSSIANTAEFTFNFFSYTALIGGALMVAGLAAASYLSERERGIWDMLSTSLIPPWSLVGAKFASVLTSFLLVLVGCAPVVATLYFLIGIDPFRFGWNAAIIASTLIATTAMASGAAAWTRKATTAMRLAYVIAVLNLGLYLIPIYLVAALIQLFYPQNGLLGSWLYSTLLPATAPLYLLTPDSIRGLLGDAIGIFLTYQLVLTLLGLFAAYVGVKRRRMVRESETRGMRRAAAGAGSQWDGRTPFTDRRNPVYVREWRWGLFSRRRGFWLWLITCGFATLLISMMFVVTIRLQQGFLGSGEEIMLASVYLHGLVVLLAVPASLSNILTKERENQTGLLLATTTLSPGEVAMGKLMAACRLGFLAWFVSLLANLVLAGQLALVNVDPSRMLLGHITLLFCTVCVASITVCASTFSKKTRGAVALSGFLGFMAILGFAIGLFLLIALVGGFSMINKNDDFFAALFFTLSPIGAYLSLFQSPLESKLPIWLADLFYLIAVTLVFAHLTQRRLAKSIRNGFDT